MASLKARASSKHFQAKVVFSKRITLRSRKTYAASSSSKKSTKPSCKPTTCKCHVESSSNSSVSGLTRSKKSNGPATTSNRSDHHECANSRHRDKEPRLRLRQERRR